MSVINMAKNIKKIHPDSLICYKVGNFFNCYGKDAYVLSYLFDYKIKSDEHNITITGFPRTALSKVTATIQRKKIDYKIIDTRNNYHIDEEESFNNLNEYSNIFDKAHSCVKLKLRIQKISDALEKELNIDKIRKIEEIVYENRKV